MESFDDDDDETLTFREGGENKKQQNNINAGTETKRRKEGFFEVYTESTNKEGKTVRRGYRTSYDKDDWRWRNMHERRLERVFYFAAGFFAFALLRAVILFG